MKQKKQVQESEDSRTLTDLDQKKGLAHPTKNIKKKLAMQNPAFEFYFSNGIVQYRKKR